MKVVLNSIVRKPNVCILRQQCKKQILLKLTIKMMRPLPAAILRILTAWGKEGS